jgi:PAS domain S-box-containing protein
MEIVEQDPQREIDELRRRLGEAEETLTAIRSGMVDALLVTGREGEKVFILKGADHPYRIMVEEMNEGAVTLAGDGTILYCNRRFAELLKTGLEQVIGSSIRKCFVPEKDLESLVQTNVRGSAELQMRCSDGSDIPVLVSYNPVLIGICNPPA